MTQRKSEPDDRVLRVHAIVRGLYVRATGSNNCL